MGLSKMATCHKLVLVVVDARVCSQVIVFMGWRLKKLKKNLPPKIKLKIAPVHGQMGKGKSTKRSAKGSVVSVVLYFVVLVSFVSHVMTWQLGNLVFRRVKSVR